LRGVWRYPATKTIRKAPDIFVRANIKSSW
jgi:hypothetical protein